MDDEQGLKPVAVASWGEHTAISNLLCPCGDIYLHHYHVTLYERPREDAETVRVEIGDYHEGDDRVVLENPSSRRDAVGVRFWCECCDGRWELTISQHKGATLIEWRQVDPAAALAEEK